MNEMNESVRMLCTVGCFMRSRHHTHTQTCTTDIISQTVTLVC